MMLANRCLLALVFVGLGCGPKRPDGAAQEPRTQEPRCEWAIVPPGVKFTITARDTTSTNRVIALEETDTIDRKAPTKTTKRSALTINNQPLLTTTSQHEGKEHKVTVEYGADFSGIRRAEVTNDGTQLRGQIDGRAIVPLAVGADPSTVRFADGLPPPKVEVDPAIADTIQKLFAAVHARAPKCAQEPDQPPASGELQPRGDSGHDSDTFGTFDCIACLGLCATVSAACAAAVPGICAATVFFYGICLAAGEAACAGTALLCEDNCRANGSTCCPVGCGTYECCLKNETCLNHDTGLCCSSGRVGCMGKQCCKQSETCIQSGSLSGTCCDSDKLCGQNCCDSDSKCQNGSCCKKDKACGSACCGIDDKCADSGKSLCCPGLSGPVCGNKCCGLGQSCCNGACCVGSCINNACCPSERACGAKCCASGSSCESGTCKACPQGQSPCTGGGCCPTGQTCSGTPTARICCPSGQEVCDGQCRPIGACIK